MSLCSVQSSESPRYGYCKEDFARVAKILLQRSGIKLADSKQAMVYSRLSRRLSALKMDNFSDYLDRVEAEKEESQHFVNAMTTNLTAFFREAHHFDMLRDYLELHKGALTIWCAASSTGEEPYSIAMTVAEAYRCFDTPIKIIASDIDSRVLDQADQGIYPLDSAKGLSSEQLHTYFQRGVGENLGLIKVRQELRNMVELKQLNLTKTNWNLPKHIDIIFCRNVMIYFDKPTQLKVLENMLQRLNLSGLYFAGHSENYSDVSHWLKLVGRSVYKPAVSKVA